MSNPFRMLKRRAPRLLKDDAGTIAIMWGLLMPIALGFTAFGVEVGLWYSAKRDLQSMADAAAFAAALEKLGGSSDEALVGQEEAERNGFDATTHAITFNTPPVESAVYAGDADSIEVIVSRAIPPLLSAVLTGRQDDIIVAARTVVQTTTSLDGCIIGLRKNTTPAVRIRGTAEIEMAECDVVSPNALDPAVDLNGTPVVHVDRIGAAGAISMGANVDFNGEKVRINPFDDPLADKTPPTEPTPCTETGNVTINSCPDPTNPVVLSGKYCGDVTVGVSGCATASGLVYIKDGNLRVQGTLTGTGTTIYMGGSSAGDVTVNATATVTLTAPGPGEPHAGMLFWQSPDASGTTVFNGGATMSLTGILYFPSTEVQWNGNNMGTSQCLKLIAGYVDLAGTAGVSSDGACEAAGVESLEIPGGVAFVE